MIGRRALLVGGALAPFVAQPAAAQVANRPGYWNMDWSWGHMAYGGLTMILFWGGLILLVILAVRWLGVRGHPDAGTGTPSHRATPMEVLEERFARGEIDEEEFNARRRVLRGDQG